MNRPEFSQKLSPEKFLQYYWYRAELAVIAKRFGISHQGTKAQLQSRLLRFLKTGKIVTVAGHKRNKIETAKISPKTRILEGGFRFNQTARDFFGRHFKIAKFNFIKEMAAAVRRAEEMGDQRANVQDLIDIYSAVQRGTYKNPNAAEEKTYRWNRFVKDFCADNKTKIYPKKLVVAAYLWRIVRTGIGEKKYNSGLLQKYQNDLKKFV